jgi:alpha-1,2-mannosyltransferase
MVSFA